MAFVLADRVKESTTSPGTGTATLNGAATGYQSFSAGIGANNTTYYTIADQSGSNWEVGYGTVGSGGTTLARTTVLASSNSGSLVNFSSGTQDVWCDYPAKKAVYQDTNSNVSVNCLFEGFTSQAQSGTTIVLTASSVQNWVITGSGGQTIQLPNATTLPNGALFTFNNNQSSGTIVVQNNSGTTICTTQSGAFITVTLLNNSSSAGSWDYHNSAPSNATWSTNTLSWSGTISGTTWNGATIGTYYGGTGLSGSSPFTAANNAIYSTSSSALTAGTLPIAAGGTGATTASTAFNALSPVTTLGDLIYGSGTNTNARLAGNTTSTKNFLVQTGTGTVSAAPTWGTISAADVPTLNQNTTGTAANITATSNTTLTSLANLVTVGTIGTGTWNGSIIAGQYGGTGVNNGSSTITLGGSVTYSGAYTQTWTRTANTSLTLPTSGYLISTTTNMAANPVTGTPSSSTYLRGDGTWATISAGSPGGSNTQVQYNSSGSFAGSANFTFDGTNVLVAGTVSGGSDERLKTNWRSVQDNYIAKLANVKAGIFDRTDLNITQPGVSAQSLQEVLPEAVLTGEEGWLSVNYGGAALLSVIELAKEVVELRAKIEALEAK